MQKNNGFFKKIPAFYYLSIILIIHPIENKRLTIIFGVKNDKPTKK